MMRNFFLNISFKEIIQNYRKKNLLVLPDTSYNCTAFNVFPHM